MDIISDLIQHEIARQIAANRQPLIYGVWIDGAGWLKLHNGVAFADTRREVAETAVMLWGKGARMMAIDNRMPPQMDESALEELASQFIIHQHRREINTWFYKLVRLWRRKQAGAAASQ